MSDEKKEQNAPEAKQAEGGEEKQSQNTAPLKGIIGRKIGMTRVFVEENLMVPVTVVSAEGVTVSQVKSKDSDGYNAVQISYEDVEDRKLSKAEVNHFKKKNLPIKRHLAEFRVDDVSPFKVGQTVPVSVFQAGEWVQATGVSKGKGFAGTIKRFGFGGGPHSHGHGEYRRSPGSSGGQGPQHVLPGTRKPGHKGAVISTVPSSRVVGIDEERSLILLRGSVPGPNGNTVLLRPSTKVRPAEEKSAKGKKK